MCGNAASDPGGASPAADTSGPGGSTDTYGNPTDMSGMQAQNVSYSPGMGPGTPGGAPDAPGTPGGGSIGVESLAEQTGLTPSQLAEMQNAGMNVNNFIDIAIAKAGFALGLPPNPALASQKSIITGLLGPLSLVGVPVRQALSFIENPSVKTGLSVIGAGIGGASGIAGGSVMGDMAGGAMADAATQTANTSVGPASNQNQTAQNGTSNSASPSSPSVSAPSPSSPNNDSFGNDNFNNRSPIMVSAPSNNTSQASTYDTSKPKGLMVSYERADPGNPLITKDTDYISKYFNGA